MKKFDIDFNIFELAEFKGDIKSLKEDIKKIQSLYNIEIDRYKLYEDTYACITKKEFASGGYSIHRGYYCPDLYETITTGGCSRGKLLKRLTKKSVVSYEYCYEGEYLSLIKCFDDPRHEYSRKGVQSIEFLEREGNIEIGVEFAVNSGDYDYYYKFPEYITVTQYDKERIVNTRTFCSSIVEKRNNDVLFDSFDYQMIWYEYNDKNMLVSIRKASYDCGNGLELKKIVFEHDRTGCLDYYHFSDDIEEHKYKVSDENRNYYCIVLYETFQGANGRRRWV